MSEIELIPTNIYGLDVYDQVTNLSVGRVKYDGADSLLETMSRFEFDSRVFAGEAVNPEQGSIVSPERTVRFFPQTNSMHVIYTHSTSNITSLKKIIRAVMPSNFITEPHWFVLYTREDIYGSNGFVTSQNFYSSTNATMSVDTSYYALLELLQRMRGSKYGEDAEYFLLELAVVIRREL